MKDTLRRVCLTAVTGLGLCLTLLPSGQAQAQAQTQAQEQEQAPTRVPCNDITALKAAINKANTGGSSIVLARNCTYSLTAADNTDDGLPEITGKVRISGEGTIIQRPQGDDSVAAIAGLTVGVGGEVINLFDIADVYRARQDNPSLIIRQNGVDAFTLGVAGISTENIVAVGQRVDARLAELEGEIPFGVEIEPIYQQHVVVDKSVNDFLKNLVVSDRGILIEDEGSHATTWRGNIVWATGEAEYGLEEAGIRRADPGLVKRGLLYRLGGADSQAVNVPDVIFRDVGAPVPGSEMDMDGQKRDDMPDVGCDEWSDETLRLGPMDPKDVGPEWMGGDPDSLERLPRRELPEGSANI